MMNWQKRLELNILIYKRMNDKYSNWADFHQKMINTSYPIWPNESLVKLFFGNYLVNKPRLNKGQKILDVGCGFGQNFRPFLVEGLKCFGVEVDPEICKITNKLFENEDVEVRNGHNRLIPFDDGYFDYVISINAIHYESNEKDMVCAIEEHKRVLKKGGLLVIFTVGPKHLIFKNAKYLGNNKYKIQNFDFRDGQHYYYFGSVKEMGYYLDPLFSRVEYGRVTEELMSKPLDFLIAVAEK